MSNQKSITARRMAAVFNEWANRYADSPDEFDELLGPDGRPLDDYGDRCAAYFDKLAAELDAEGALPVPEGGYTLHMDGQGRGIEWDGGLELFVIDGVRVSADFLIALVNSTGETAVQIKRNGNSCECRSVRLAGAKEIEPEGSGR